MAFDSKNYADTRKAPDTRKGLRRFRLHAQFLSARRLCRTLEELDREDQ